MKKSLKRVIAVVLMCSGIAGMTGCGSNKSATGGKEKIKLTLWNKPTQDAKDIVKESYEETMKLLAEEFPDIEFISEVAPSGTDYRQEYDKRLMAGNAPDIFTRFSYTDIPSRIANGTVADITDLVDNWQLKKDKKILDVFDDAISKDGKWYALPLQAYTQATLVNTKTLKAAGENPDKLPETWDEFANIGKRITDLSVPRFGYSLVGMDWCAWPYTAWVWSAGGEMVRKNDDGTYKLAFTEDAGVDAAQYLNSLIWEYKMTQKDILIGYDDLKKNIQNGTSAFAWATFTDLKQEDLDQYGLTLSDYSIMPMPVRDKSIKRPALSGGEVVTFNPKASPEQLEAAFAVAERLYFSDKAMQSAVNHNANGDTINTMVPGRVDWYEKLIGAIPGLTEDSQKMLVNMSDGAKAEPYCEHWSDIKSQLAPSLQQIYLKQGISRDEISKILNECADKLYDLYPETFRK